MKKWEWERLRDGYRAQRNKTIAEGRYKDARYYDRMFRWTLVQIDNAE